jgi:hypothetical protein
MTLVVTDVSRHGIIAVGDSALTVTDTASSEKHVLDSVLGSKISFVSSAKICLSAWGNFGVNGRRLDYWLADYARNRIKPGMPPKEVAEDLGESLNSALQPDFRNGIAKGLRRGVHVAGYKDGIPELFHVHMGEEEGPHHPLIVQQHALGDDPDHAAIHRFLARSSVHVRNGMWRRFVQRFDRAFRGGDALSAFDGDLRARCDFFSSLIIDVADTLRRAGELPSVNKAVSAIAFNSGGIVVDMRIPVDGPELVQDLSGSEQLAA